MTNELKKSIESLRSIAPKLNAATDKAASVVAEVERLLGEELSIGIPAEVDFESQSRKVPRDEYSDKTVEVEDALRLAYGRSSSCGSFRLMVEQYRVWPGEYVGDSIEEVLQQWPWGSAPRKLKLDSFAVLPDLLTRIAEEAGKSLSAADAASEIVIKAADALPQNEPVRVFVKTTEAPNEPVRVSVKTTKARTKQS